MSTKIERAGGHIMYLKYKTQKLVDKYADLLAKDLRINNWNIEVHLINSKGKKSREKTVKLGIDFNWAKKQFAVTSLNTKNKEAIVVIFYDKMRHKKDVISTLYHEYVHICLDQVLQYFTKKQVNKYNLEDKEENVVHVLEKAYIRWLK